VTGPVDFVELDAPTCLGLLARATVGRVVFTDGAMPAAQPVNYALRGGQIIFRTHSGAKLAAATRRAVVGFEVDEIDPATRTGWSVLGIGEAFEIHDRDRLAELAATIEDPWAPGQDTHTIAIPLSRLTGRRISPAATLSPGSAPRGTPTRPA
jgi:nitroimidazol reductase NimA-like FMN-containing flavoprotein (pyridoxamine 5'-phosphate oxidase superfamily)